MNIPTDIVPVEAEVENESWWSPWRRHWGFVTGNGWVDAREYTSANAPGENA